MITKIVKIIFYKINANLGIRRYFKVNGVLYVKEGLNKPEILFEHNIKGVKK